MPVPQTMSHIEMTAPGGPEVLRLITGPVPTPKPDEVLIRVQAAGVNRPDIAQRSGSYPPPPGAPVPCSALKSPARSLPPAPP
jgi:NADPH2:quinone reductase